MKLINVISSAVNLMTTKYGLMGSCPFFPSQFGIFFSISLLNSLNSYNATLDNSIQFHEGEGKKGALSYISGWQK